MSELNHKFSDINKHLDLPHQNWLFGAGISVNANVPLMNKLTRLVEKDLSDNERFSEAYQEIKGLFVKKDSMHIEHILSHIGDLIALIERTAGEKLTINQYDFNKMDLYMLYNRIIERITYIVRYGNRLETDEPGTIENPVVKIDEHRNFVNALFSRIENLEGRSNVNFFTTNYDTLLEDALILEKKKVIDGFEGSAMGFWDPTVFKEKNMDEFFVCKLHGSIDWYQNSDEGLVRTRYGTTYLEKKENTMIYPQATKYVETQKDPFAFLFEKFRNILNNSVDSILCICGYSFGDNHINNEIENALLYPGNQLTILVFLKELTEDNIEVNRWLRDTKINDRVYVMTQKGIYHEGKLHSGNYEGQENRITWWSFDGLTELLRKGEEYDVS